MPPSTNKNITQDNTKGVMRSRGWWTWRRYAIRANRRL